MAPAVGPERLSGESPFSAWTVPAVLANRDEAWNVPVFRLYLTGGCESVKGGAKVSHRGAAKRG